VIYQQQIARRRN